MDYKKLQNGSDIRGVALEGVAGQSVNLTEQACRDIGRGFALWLMARTGKKEGLRVSVGRDSRLSGETLGGWICAAMAEQGLQVTDFGAARVSLKDKKSGIDVVQGFDSVEGYVNTRGICFGASIGRAANRIAKGHFSLNGKEYQLFINNNGNTLHGGEFGFGAEIGISTQKLHARGPMGLKELTTYKYIIRGNGHIR